MYHDATLARRSVAWPTPTLVLVEDTWIGDLPVSPFNPEVTLAEDIDGILHLGPPERLSRVAARAFPDGDP